MYLKGLSVRGIRNYSRLDVSLSPGLNLFFGDNAKGKTNLLEAACFLGSLRSFRGVKPAALLSWGAKEGRVSGEVAGAGVAKKIAVGLSEGKRRVTVDGKKPGSAREYLLVLKVSSFSPEDLFLVKEYPAHRRRFLDRSIFHLHPGYLDLANRYAAAVRQINAAFKAGEAGVIGSYEELILPLAAEVAQKRREQADALAPLATELYDRVLGGGRLETVYRTAAKGGSRQELESSYRALLEKKRPEGLRRGCLMAGPHTDDLAVTLSGRDMKLSASRGQSRLAMLALVLADAELYHAERGEYPVLLLDDVASELDVRRRDALMEYITGRGQALLTATEPALLDGREGQTFRVETNPEGEALLSFQVKRK